MMAIAYNGELYNYRELRAELRGFWKFTSEGDTEVALAAYAKWGRGCLPHFNGMFALAVWDEARGRLFLARDRMGEKPLYYSQIGGHFFFASEVAPLQVLGADKSINYRDIYRYLTATTASTFEVGNSTLFTGIRRLEAAHSMEIAIAPDHNVAESRTSPYWVIPQRPRSVKSLTTATEILRDILTDSVALRLRSDVPVGTCLSGGLDSSAIVAIMRRQFPDTPIHTFTGSFPGSKTADESAYAGEVATTYGTISHFVPITAPGFLASAAKLYSAAGLPLGGLSQFAQWEVFKLAAEHGVTVLLDGQGADEIFAGYGNSIRTSYLRDLLRNGKLSTFSREAWLTRSADEVRVSLVGVMKRLAASEFERRIVVHRLKPYLSVEGVELLTHQDNDVAATAVHPGHEFDGILRILTQQTMLPSLLRYGDHLSMRHSREVRLPFCDHRVVEMAFNLDPRLLIGDGSTKRVLRSAMAGLLPQAILNRPKHGFVPPEREWLLGPLLSWLLDMITSCSSDLRRLFNITRLVKISTNIGDTDPVALSNLWRIANLGAWDVYSRCN